MRSGMSARKAQQRITGHYITQRDGGLRYDYEAAWSRDGSRFFWEAQVKRGGDLKGKPNGHLLKAPIYPEKAVRAVVEHSIEILAGVEK